jgi:Mg-chelatase subunit ChlD
MRTMSKLLAAVAAAGIAIGVLGSLWQAPRAEAGRLAPAADDSPCSSLDADGEPLSAREILSPNIRICDTTTVSVTLNASCGAIPLHVMLNLDYSGSMIGQPWVDAKEAALALIRELDLPDNPETQIGLVYHGIQPDSVALSNNAGPVQGQINRIQPGGEDNLPAAIDVGATRLVQARPRGELTSFDVMVILSDGGQTFPPQQAVSAAGRAKSRDILIVAVCLENGFSACPQMRQMASGPQFYFESQGTSGLARIFREIADDLRDINLRQMSVAETLPDGIRYIPGSGVPEPDVEGQTLSWQFRFIPKTGVTIQYGISATNVTTYTLAENVTTFKDSQDRTGSVLVPSEVLTITGLCTLPITPTPTYTPTPTPTVFEPTDTPTPTPTLTPTPTPRPGKIFLPILGLGRCIELDRPVDIVLAIDASSSMQGSTSAGRTKLEAAVEAARGFVNRMREGEQVAVLSFNDTVTIHALLTSDRAALGTALDQIGWSPFTRIDLALIAAHEELNSERRRPESNRVVVLLTDGQPTHTTPEAVAAAAAAARDDGIIVFTIGLGPDVDAELLRTVAGDPSRAFTAPDGEDLEQIYSMIREKLPCR